MATTSGNRSETPGLGPVPEEMLVPNHPDDDFRTAKEEMVYARPLMRHLNRTGAETHAPYTWGFTIYRAAFPADGCSDERFAAGLERMEAWIRWEVHQKRYGDGALYVPWEDCPPHWKPQPGAWDPTDELARRFWNKVVEEYPGRDQIRCGPSVDVGDEDFMAIADAFVAWVEQPENPSSRHLDALNVRNDHCLVIDERALQSLEQLPAVVPEVKEWTFSEYRSQSKPCLDAWVWIVDRERVKQWKNYKEDPEKNTLPELGPPLGLRPDLYPEHEQPAPPWIRIRLRSIPGLWFERPERLTPLEWGRNAERDRNEPKVFWWGHQGLTLAMIAREQRAGARLLS